MTGSFEDRTFEPLRARLGLAARRATARFFALSGRSARQRRRLDGSRAAILMYHRVLPRSEAERLHVEPGMFVTPETFARHLEWLARSFSVLPLHEIVESLRANEPLPRGACAVTFDDGWRDNFEYALPALARQGLPATVFVVADRVGTLGAFWPDEICRQWATTKSIERCARLREAALDPAVTTIDGVITALKALDEDARLLALAILLRAGDVPKERELLDWDELERLAAGGVAVESHSASHAILTGVSRQRVREELTRSLRVLQERGHARHALLAYPSGAFDDEVVSVARESGYRAAFTTAAGLATAGEDPLVLPRVAVHEDISGSRVEFLRWVPGAA